MSRLGVFRCLLAWWLTPVVVSVLSYPFGVPGAVNITNSDVARLEPGEYLNDTILEFALK